MVLCQRDFIISFRYILTNLLFLEEITTQVVKGHPVDIICMGFSKDFDKVPHRNLLEKLKAHCIGLTHQMDRSMVMQQETEWF